MSDGEIKETIDTENGEIREELGAQWLEDIKIVARRQCRNRYKENIIVETNIKTFKYLMKKGKICFDLMMIHVDELIDTPVCFKCTKLGHVAKHCTEKTEKCYKCGGNHAGNNCGSSKLNCANCEAAKISADMRKHSARDKNCPVYIKRLEVIRRNATYNE